MLHFVDFAKFDCIHDIQHYVDWSIVDYIDHYGYDLDDHVEYVHDYHCGNDLNVPSGYDHDVNDNFGYIGKYFLDELIYRGNILVSVG